MFVQLSLALLSLALQETPATSPQTPAPFAEDFENVEPNRLPDGWFVPTQGYEALVTEEDPGAGRRSLVLRPVEDKGAPFGNCMRAFDAQPFAGQRVVLSALVRVEAAGGGRAQMWLRVDRPNSEMGAFDNMGDRPIRPGGWERTTITADVDADGVTLNLGFMSFGQATVHVDDVRLESKGPSAKPREIAPPRPLTPRGLVNLVAATRLLAYVRFFDASDACAGVEAWDHFAVDLMNQVEDARDSADLAKRLSAFFAPVAPTLQVWAGSRESGPPPPSDEGAARGRKHWEHHGAGFLQKSAFGAYSSRRTDEPLDAERFLVKPLADDVFCRWTFSVPFDSEGTLPHAKTPEAWMHADALPKLSALDRTTRLAGVAIAWGVFQHFYPYFDVVGTDWNAALPPALEAAAKNATVRDYLRTLQELVAKLHDGHGGVWKLGDQPRPTLQLRLKSVGQDFVVAGKSAATPPEVEVGDALVSIDGRPVEACCKELSTRLSAAREGRIRALLSGALVSDLDTADPARVTFKHVDGREYACALARGPEFPKDALSLKKPANGAEVAPGIVYFDLNAASADALAKVVEKLDAADGIVFDLRGYPNDAAMTVLRRLIGGPATSAYWNVPIVTRPDREGMTFSTGGRWNLEPQAPRWTMPVAFMTDASAISYAESIMGIVENYKLGEIVGSTTAGTNGNVNPFTLPGGIQVSWTGMQVLKHDGSRHHGVGIQPTVPVAPTAKGIAEGRDEVLEKAVEVVQAKVRATKK
jgi:hypothetical protein